jgi:putative ABC transport system substrate-binding protein
LKLWREVKAKNPRAASYVKKTLDGAKPGDLPFYLPERLYLVLNLKAARAQGLEIPVDLLASADKVIE